MRIDAPNLRHASGVPVLELLQSSRVTAATAQVEFTLPYGYESFLLKLTNVRPETDAVGFNLRFSTDGGATYDSTLVYLWTLHNLTTTAATNQSDSSDTEISLTGTTAMVGNVDGEGLNATVKIYNVAKNTAKRTMLSISSTFLNDSGLTSHSEGSARHGKDGVVSHVRVAAGAGNIAKGEFQLYGIRES